MVVKWPMFCWLSLGKISIWGQASNRPFSTFSIGWWVRMSKSRGITAERTKTKLIKIYSHHQDHQLLVCAWSLCLFVWDSRTFNQMPTTSKWYKASSISTTSQASSIQSMKRPAKDSGLTSHGMEEVTPPSSLSLFDPLFILFLNLPFILTLPTLYSFSTYILSITNTSTIDCISDCIRVYKWLYSYKWVQKSL